MPDFQTKMPDLRALPGSFGRAFLQPQGENMFRMTTPPDRLDLNCWWIENSTSDYHKITGVDDGLPSANNRTSVYVESVFSVRKSMDLMTFVSNYTPYVALCDRVVRCA